MKSFKLIHELQHNKPIVVEQQSNPIKYQQYDLQLGTQTQRVWIPIRECEAFEQTLVNIDDITIDTLQNVLRRHRGVKNHKE